MSAGLLQLCNHNTSYAELNMDMIAQFSKPILSLMKLILCYCLLSSCQWSRLLILPPGKLETGRLETPLFRTTNCGNKSCCLLNHLGQSWRCLQSTVRACSLMRPSGISLLCCLDCHYSCLDISYPMWQHTHHHRLNTK